MKSQIDIYYKWSRHHQPAESPAPARDLEAIRTLVWAQKPSSLCLRGTKSRFASSLYGSQPYLNPIRKMDVLFPTSIFGSSVYAPRLLHWGLSGLVALWRHCNTLHHSAPHCTTLHHTASHCNTLQHTATHCNTLQHTNLKRRSTRVKIGLLVLHTVSVLQLITLCNWRQQTARQQQWLSCAL